MKTLLAALFACLTVLSSPAFAEPKKEPPAKEKAGKLKYEGGDGSSMQKAVVILGAKNSRAGIDAEYAWVAKKYPGYQRRQQALMSDKGKHYDMLSITTKDGKNVDVYFDITEFFGKF